MCNMKQAAMERAGETGELHSAHYYENDRNEPIAVRARDTALRVDRSAPVATVKEVGGWKFLHIHGVAVSSRDRSGDALEVLASLVNSAAAAAPVAQPLAPSGAVPDEQVKELAEALEIKYSPDSIKWHALIWAVKSLVKSISDRAAQPLAGQDVQAVTETYTLPFHVETDKHEVVSIWDADGNGLPFELNTHTQLSLDDLEGLAEELKAAQALAGFMVAGMNALAAQPLAGQDVRAVTEEQLCKMARGLADWCANECGIDKDDNWKIYSEDFMGQIKVALHAAGFTAPSPVNPKQEQN